MDTMLMPEHARTWATRPVSEPATSITVPGYQFLDSQAKVSRDVEVVKEMFELELNIQVHIVLEKVVGREGEEGELGSCISWLLRSLLNYLEPGN